MIADKIRNMAELAGATILIGAVLIFVWIGLIGVGLHYAVKKVFRK